MSHSLKGIFFLLVFIATTAPAFADSVQDARGWLCTTDTEAGLIRCTHGTESVILAENLPEPTSLALGQDRSIYVCSQKAGSLHRVRPTGEVELLREGLPSPNGIAVDRDGTILVTTNDGKQTIRIAAP